ncbi:PARP-domain-containing protein [Parathielavia appendiculata]|uniref:Poly [ADP-ribose] polymerase n=1 Tax=Parathielavia appendiculata TaxID=2587402 RepID=A0AAN6TUG0_9PEZI|nr:PARP-domain-containing protein [Parathielavia appendiculata]
MPRGKKAAAAAATPALEGCKLALSGTFPGATHASIKTRAEALGATVASSVTDDVTHLVATEADLKKPSPKVVKAQSLGIHIVSLDWLSNCEKNCAKEDEQDYILGGPAKDTAAQADASKSSQANGTSRTRKRAAPLADDVSDNEVAPKAKRTRGGKAAAVKTEDDIGDANVQDADRAADLADVKLEEGNKGKAKAERAMGEGQVAKSSDLAIPLDEGCPFVTSKVYIDDSGIIYDASLNQTNAGKNNNKFYRIQLLVDPTGTYRTWTRWGRVGERGQTAVPATGSLNEAMRQFEKKFKDKSGLPWSDRGSNPKPGKYAFVERSYEEDSDEEDEAESAKEASDRKELKSTLDPAVQELMRLIFNQQYWDATMANLNYDANKLPLGKLSKATILRGFQTLKDLSALIDDNSLAAGYGMGYGEAVEQLSNTFYSLIPHAFGRNRPPVISDQQMVKREIELLESLSDMKDAALIMKMDKAGDDDVHPLDKQYQGLKMQEMTPLGRSSNEFAELQKYLLDTRGATHGHHYEVDQIFRIERQGEHERFDSSVFGKMSQNRRLLWHGSRCTNFGGILSQGLRIAPPEAPVSGYMFGKGIYLADMSSKSANYCCSYMSGGTALLLLCEAELGNPMQELVNASYNAGEDAKKKGMVSTWGQGRTGPSKWKDASCVHPSLAGVMMPDTSVPPGDTNIPGAGLYYNEYIAYDVAQRATTCVTCRARKVRCDGRRGICTNCERLGFGCSYDETVSVEVVPGESSGAAISVPRRRVRQACQNCHARKARCSGALPACDRCRAQGLECVYRPGKRSLPLPFPNNPNSAAAAASGSGMDTDVQMSQNHGPSNDYATSSSTASPATGTADQTDPDEALALKAFDSFFRHIHHIAMFSFLHRPSLLERYHAGSLDRALVLALIGITSLMTDLGPGVAEYGDRCVEEAVQLCLANLEKPTIPRLQALVLAIKHRILSKRFSSAFMLHAIASRSATALRLSHENPDLCFLARESRRRLMWSIYMIDASISTGQPDVALWNDAEHQIHLQLPCNERNFDFDLPDPTELLRGPGPDSSGVVPPLPDVLGLMALHIRLYWMRTRILQCTSRAAGSASADALAVLPSQLAEFAAELELFEARLPISFRENEANYRLRSYSPRLGIFLTTHLLWRQCHLDMYRPFLPGLREAIPPAALQQLDQGFVMHKRRSCYEHAKAMADMFAQLLSLSGACGSPPVADLDLPGCAFQCSRVLYHGLQTDNGELGFTQERVQELVAVCLRAARQSTPGPACASIQADIERLLSNGLSLPEVPTAAPARARSVAPGMDTPYLGPQIPGPDHHMQLLGPVPPRAVPSPADQTHAHESSMQMPPPPTTTTTVSPMAQVTLSLPPMTGTSSSRPALAGVAPSQASAVTSGSNAFEELPDGLNFGPNFGPEFFGIESWSALSQGWTDLGQFPGSTIS